MTPENVAYLAALVSVSEEVRSRCHLKYSVARSLSKSASTDTFAVDPHLNLPLTSSQVSGISNPQGVSHQHSGGASSPSNHISSPGLSFPTIGSFSSLVSVLEHLGSGVWFPGMIQGNWLKYPVSLLVLGRYWGLQKLQYKQKPKKLMNQVVSRWTFFHSSKLNRQS